MKVPVGQMILSPAPPPDPENWLPCDGRTFERRAFPQLAEALRGMYGGTEEEPRVPRLPAPDSAHTFYIRATP